MEHQLEAGPQGTTSQVDLRFYEDPRDLCGYEPIDIKYFYWQPTKGVGTRINSVFLLAIPRTVNA
jgi:hypothetical protein